MPALPNPWLSDPTPRSAEAAVALNRPPVPDAAAEPFDEPTSSKGGHQEAPAVDPNTVAAAGATDDVDHIHEIFHFARKLMAQYNAVHRRFVLDEALFMEAIEPPPLFLQRSA